MPLQRAGFERRLERTRKTTLNMERKAALIRKLKDNADPWGREDATDR
jgi:hypothetical protein